MIESYYTQTINIKKAIASTATWAEGSWGTSSTHAAAVNPVSGNEAYALDKKGLVADYKVYCGSSVTVDETRRLRWNSKDHDVVFVKNTFAMNHHKTVYIKARDE
jgi:head-tail adaptor